MRARQFVVEEPIEDNPPRRGGSALRHTPTVADPGEFDPPARKQPSVAAPGEYPAPQRQQQPYLKPPGGGANDAIDDTAQQMQDWDNLSDKEKAKRRWEARKKYLATMKNIRSPFLTKIAGHPIFNWIGTAISSATIVKILWQYDMYLVGYEKVEEFGKKLAPCDDDSWDPFDDPYLDIDYNNPDREFSIAQAGIVSPKDGTVTSFGGNQLFSDEERWESYLILNPLWYVIKAGWVTRAGRYPLEPTTRNTFSRRLGSWFFNLFVNTLTGVVVASKLIMKLSRIAAVFLAGTGLGMPAAIITLIIGGGASWMISLAIDRFMKRKEQWLRPLTNAIGSWLLRQIATESAVNFACSTRETLMSLGTAPGPSIEVPDDDPSNTLFDLDPTVNEAQEKGKSTNSANSEVMQLAEIIDADYAEMFSQVCADVLEDMRNAVAKDPTKSRELEQIISQAEARAKNNAEQLDEII
jgi:hypothetical protein